MIPVIDAIREGIERFAIKVGKPWCQKALERFREGGLALSEWLKSCSLI
jgi:hypothetical protein